MLYEYYHHRGWSVDGGGGSGVHKYVVFGQLCNILLQLGELLLAILFLVFNSERVQLALVSQSLIFSVHDLPLLLQGFNELLSLVIRQQKLGLISLILFFELHLPHQLVLVINFILNFLKELGNLSVIFLLQKVFILIRVHLWCYTQTTLTHKYNYTCKDVFNSIRNNEILIRHETHDRLFIFLGDSSFFLIRCVIEFIGYRR